MNKKQKEKLFNGCSSFVKWTATIILAFGLSMQLSTTGSEDIVIASLGLMFTGVVLFIVYSIISHDRSVMLLSTIGFAVIVGALLDTESARLLVPELAIYEEEGFFTKYGKIIITVLKEFA
jgi:hypothetical protein